LAALTTGTVDAAVVYANNEPAVLAAEGTSYNVIYVGDYVDLVSAVLVSSDTYAQENPGQAKRFVGAFLRGLQDVLDDPEAAFTISQSYVEGLAENRETQRAVLAASIDLWEAPTLGYMDRTAWQEAQDVMAEAGMLQTTVPVEDLYTNAFLPGSD
jgi:NitT/TauT family transport system substrate-binding protein